MNQGTRNQLEVELNKMINQFDQIKAKQQGTNNLIWYWQYYSP